MADRRDDGSLVTLKAVLAVCSIVMTLGGIFAILVGPGVFAELMSTFARRAIVVESATSILIVKLFGAVLLTWGVLLYSAYTDPVRNAAIVRGSIIGFLAVAVALVLAVATTDLTRDFALPLLLVRPVICVAVAGLLYRYRPINGGRRSGGRPAVPQGPSTRSSFNWMSPRLPMICAGTASSSLEK